MVRLERERAGVAISACARLPAPRCIVCMHCRWTTFTGFGSGWGCPTVVASLAPDQDTMARVGPPTQSAVSSYQEDYVDLKALVTKGLSKDERSDPKLQMLVAFMAVRSQRAGCAGIVGAPSLPPTHARTHTYCHAATEPRPSGPLSVFTPLRLGVAGPASLPPSTPPCRGVPQPRPPCASAVSAPLSAVSAPFSAVSAPCPPTATGSRAAVAARVPARCRHPPDAHPRLLIRCLHQLHVLH